MYCSFLAMFFHRKTSSNLDVTSVFSSLGKRVFEPSHFGTIPRTSANRGRTVAFTVRITSFSFSECGFTGRALSDHTTQALHEVHFLRYIASLFLISILRPRQPTTDQRQVLTTKFYLANLVVVGGALMVFSMSGNAYVVIQEFLISRFRLLR